MKVGHFVVKVSSVSACIIPHTLNLPLQALKPARLVTHAIPKSPHNLSESIHLGSQVIESHI